MRLLAENFYDIATVTTEGEALGFPVSNMADTRVSRFYRRDGHVEVITMDLLVDREVDCLSIVGHNIEAATISLQAHRDNTFMPFPDVEIEILVTEYMIFDVFKEYDYRHWRIEIFDDYNPDRIQIGRIGLGKHISLPYLEPGMELPKQSTTDIAFSRTQQAYFDEGVVFRAFQLTFPYIEETDRRVIEAMWDIAHTKPVFMDFPEIPNETPLYGLFSAGDLSMAYDNNIRQYALAVEITEVY